MLSALEREVRKWQEYLDNAKLDSERTLYRNLLSNAKNTLREYEDSLVVDRLEMV